MFRRFSEITVLITFLLAVLILMVLLNGPGSFRLGNIQSMAFQLPELGVLSLAMMITMLTSGINLSIIASANLTGIVMAIILTQTIPPEATGPGGIGLVLLAILAGAIVAALIGLLNGYLIAVLDISPILATLGTMILFSGLAIVLTRGYVISGFPEAMLFIGNGMIFGIPVPILIFLACAVVMAVILQRTPLGTRIYLLRLEPKRLLLFGHQQPGGADPHLSHLRDFRRDCCHDHDLTLQLGQG